MAKLDQTWYERAADIIASSYTRPEERLGMFNEIWGEYLLATREFVGPTYTQKITISEKALQNIFEQAIYTVTGIELKQIVNYAKEMMKNGTNEAQAAAADAK